MGNSFSGNVLPGYMVNFIPKQTVPKVNGIKGAQSIRMDRESSILILDEKDPLVYLCQTDSYGNLSVDIFDIIPHKSEEEKQTEQLLNAILLMNQRLDNLEARLNESDTCEDGPETVANTESKANQTSLEHPKGNGQSKGGFKGNNGKQSDGQRR